MADAPDHEHAEGELRRGPRELAGEAMDATRDAVEAFGERARATGERVGEAARATSERVGERVDATAVALHVPIPVFRGLLHLAAAVAAIAAGIVLIAHSRFASEYVGTAIFSAGLLLTYATSAWYHRTPERFVRMKAALRKADHSMIFVLICSSFTPFALLALDGALRWVALGTMWGVAAVGITIRWFWTNVPRRVMAGTYLALGWGAAAFSPWLGQHLHAGPMVLIACGGLLYTCGALVYMFKRPNPSPRVFGFHEVFHAFTIAAATCHWTAVWMLVAS
jgi:hemolysin III